MSKCENCGHEHASETCPNCGATGKKNFPVWELVLLIFVGIPALLFGGCGLYVLINSLMDPNAELVELGYVFGGASFVIGMLIFIPIVRLYMKRSKP